MAIEFNCPHCGKLLTTSDERAGARANCPACNNLIAVPVPAPAASFAAGVPLPHLSATVAWSDSPSPLSNSLSDSSPTGPSNSTVRGGPPPPGSTAPAAQGATATPVFRPANLCPICRSPAAPGALYCSTCGNPLGYSGPPLRYASFLPRVAACLIDLVIIGVAAGIMEFVVPGHSWVAENLGFVLYVLYCSAFESSQEQATVGKRLMKIVVCGSDGRRLSFPRAAIRTLAKVLSLLMCGVGFLMPLLTLRKQALHDVLTDVVLVEK